MPGLGPGIPTKDAQCRPKRDGRDIGERSDAVLRTAMPGHDDRHETSSKLAIALDLPRQADAGDGHRRFRRQLLGALEAAVGQGLAHRLLDLALSGHAQGHEKLADAGVEDVFVHGGLLGMAGISLLLDRNASLAEIDLEALRLFPVLIQIIAEHRRDDHERPDDEIEDIVAAHGGSLRWWRSAPRRRAVGMSVALPLYRTSRP